MALEPWMSNIRGPESELLFWLTTGCLQPCPHLAERKSKQALWCFFLIPFFRVPSLSKPITSQRPISKYVTLRLEFQIWIVGTWNKILFMVLWIKSYLFNFVQFNFCFDTVNWQKRVFSPPPPWVKIILHYLFLISHWAESRQRKERHCGFLRHFIFSKGQAILE